MPYTTPYTTFGIFYWLDHQHTLSRKMREIESYIETGYAWPDGLLDRLKRKHPSLTDQDCAVVGAGLRQFLHAHLMCGGHIAMPSRVVDDLWLAFISDSGAYEAFCARVFFGSFHRAPTPARDADEGEVKAALHRVWTECCRQEGIAPLAPARLPLLFALDSRLNIKGGFLYSLDRRATRTDAGATIYPVQNVWTQEGKVGVASQGFAVREDGA